MKTAEETVQEFLFKDKPKRKYCNEFDVKDLVNLLQKFAIEYHEQQVKNLNIPDVIPSVCIPHCPNKETDVNKCEWRNNNI